MKILLINTDDYLGGAAIACLRLKKALERESHVSVKMLVQEQRKTGNNTEAIAKTWFQQKMALARFAFERLYFSFFEANKDLRYAFSPANTGIDISKHPLVQEADIIHLHWVNFGFLSLKTLENLLALGKPIVWTLHDMWAFTGGCHHSGTCEQYQLQCGDCKFLKNPADDDLSHQIWKQKNTIFLNNQLRVIACSEWLADRTKNSSLFRRFEVDNIPNPIDIEVFKPKNKTEIRQKLGLSVNKKLILFAAMKVSAKGKGFDYFEEALQILKQKQVNDEIELIIFGNADEELLQNLPFQCHNLGKLTEVEQIIEAYNAADVFVIPSLEENLPNTIMESLACGTPVVGFAIGGIPEMIEHQQNGFLAKYKSTESLSEGIEWILNHENSIILSQNARKKVEDNYAENMIAERYLAVYQQVGNFEGQ